MVRASSTLGYNQVRVHSHSVRKWSTLKKVIFKISDTQFAFYCTLPIYLTRNRLMKMETYVRLILRENKVSGPWSYPIIVKFLNEWVQWKHRISEVGIRNDSLTVFTVSRYLFDRPSTESPIGFYIIPMRRVSISTLSNIVSKLHDTHSHSTPIINN